MIPARFVKALAAVALFNGILLVCLQVDLAAADRQEEARRYTEDLRKGKNSKVKITALKELGNLAALQKSLAEPALPDIYKALEDKEPGIRAAAAQCLGQCDEPVSKAVPLLMKMLKNEKEDEVVRIGAARGLACMGPSAKAAVPTLNALIKSNKKSPLGKEANKARKAIAGKP
jgi:HEAT repeat protein